jgi:HK97 family phage prohead protease
MKAVFRTFTFEPDDIHIRSDGTGRTVEAYAAVFNQPAEIVDFEGHYREQVSPIAFNQTIARNGGRFPVFYNHGRTLMGTPSDAGSMPLGSSFEARADGKGLLTVSRYNSNPLADQTLEAIRNGDIRGMSWSGRIIAQDVKTPRGGFRARSDGELTLVTRTEIALKEFGPTPFPAYAGADIVGVRSTDLIRSLREMDDDERTELAALLNLPVARLDDAARDASPSTEAAASDESTAIEPTSGRTTSFNSLRLKARQVGAVRS